MPFNGFGIGGALEKENLGTIVRWVRRRAARIQARHLLCVSQDPMTSSSGIENGVDTFDCVSPTRVARKRRGLLPPRPLQHHQRASDGLLAHLRGLRDLLDLHPLQPQPTSRHLFKGGTSVWRKRPSPLSTVRRFIVAHSGRRPRSHQGRHLRFGTVTSSPATTPGKKP